MTTAANFEIATAFLSTLEVFVETKQDSGRAARGIIVQVSGQDVPDCPAFLEGIEAGVLFVRSERPISGNTSITVTLGDVQLPGIVAGCQPTGNEWLISVALTSCKSRLTEMVPQGLEGAIGVVDGGSGLRSCTVLNSSPYGMGLRLGFPVRMGTHVCVALESMVILGEIRHCHQKTDGSYIAGLVIIDVVTDARRESAFSVMLNNLRWKLASSFRSKDVPVYRADR